MSAQAAAAIARQLPTVIRRRDLLCGGEVDPEIWFDTHPQRAIAYCKLCPGEAECAEWAIETRQNVGVWGGTTPQRRQAEWRKRHR